MKPNLNTKDIVEQSWAAYNKWCEQWREHATIHGKMNIKTQMAEFLNVGIGKALLICANGYSLEENITTIHQYQHNVDIMVCDKAMGHLFNNGITPDYVMVADANVSYERYCEPWRDKLANTTLFMNVCGNVKWSRQNWKNRCLYLNADSIKSEVEFGKLSGCNNIIPAATNVSNQMFVLATQSIRANRNNFFGYDKIILIGFDYSWRPGGKYYAFDESAGGKSNYMKHAYCLDRAHTPCHSSGNLIFSAKWLDDYIRSYNLPVVLGSKHTILQSPPTKNLEEQLQYRYRESDRHEVLGLMQSRHRIANELAQIDRRIQAIGLDHWREYQESI